MEVFLHGRGTWFLKVICVSFCFGMHRGTRTFKQRVLCLPYIVNWCWIHAYALAYICCRLFMVGYRA